jgi:DNA-binding phage protein
VESRLFDPAEYLDSEEAISAYLEDARAHGRGELADAQAVVARARAMTGRASSGRTSAAAAAQSEEGVAEEHDPDFLRD